MHRHTPVAVCDSMHFNRKVIYLKQQQHDARRRWKPWARGEWKNTNRLFSLRSITKKQNISECVSVLCTRCVHCFVYLRIHLTHNLGNFLNWIIISTSIAFLNCYHMVNVTSGKWNDFRFGIERPMATTMCYKNVHIKSIPSELCMEIFKWEILRKKNDILPTPRIQQCLMYRICNELTRTYRHNMWNDS